MSQQDTSGSPTGWNHYAETALRHWTKERRQELRAIDDQDSFFRELGEQVAEAVRHRTEQILAEQPAAEGYAERLALELTARQIAEDDVLRTMVFDETDSETRQQP